MAILASHEGLSLIAHDGHPRVTRGSLPTGLWLCWRQIDLKAANKAAEHARQQGARQDGEAIVVALPPENATPLQPTTVTAL